MDPLFLLFSENNYVNACKIHCNPTFYILLLIVLVDDVVEGYVEFIVVSVLQQLCLLLALTHINNIPANHSHFGGMIPILLL